MKKQSIHEFSYEDRQAALEEANTLMNPHEKLSEIEKYVANTLKKNVTPILKEDELKLLIYLSKKGLNVKQ